MARMTCQTQTSSILDLDDIDMMLGRLRQQNGGRRGRLESLDSDIIVNSGHGRRHVQNPESDIVNSDKDHDLFSGPVLCMA